MNKFRALFQNDRPILGMLHLKGVGLVDRMERCVREAHIMDDAGFDGLIVENYFGSAEDVDSALALLSREGLSCKLGVNIFGSDDFAFDLAGRYPVSFIQIDSVAGHLGPEEDLAFARDLAKARSNSDAALLGGVRFKYMPVRSGRSEVEDLQIGAGRCDAIVVTSDATGQETSREKITRFRETIGADFPLIVGAGLTAQNVTSQFELSNGGIVGSWLKGTHRDDGEICAEYAAWFIAAARAASPLSEPQ